MITYFFAYMYAKRLEFQLVGTSADRLWPSAKAELHLNSKNSIYHTII
jgi:hypothetical protein